ncbi:hypothetical protein GPECTOR_18g131 [Gonium pectorale]|uniref:Secondary thiamine-phosphate synthase enzyme n=1 Tax=Gonium pectorale TaxID=33097 RepID=A0A150GJW3_GONPE|nr:hypothetical protein GPECTOR_18g131 [Gonium pectorale]|eukprot:KXZ49975.1 hypothetical protein GPECTOR_18g131 [Gonium pectorale]
MVSAPNAQRTTGQSLRPGPYLRYNGARCIASASSSSSSAPPGLSTVVRIAPSPSPSQPLAPVSYRYHQLEVPQTPPDIALVDITPQIRELVAQGGLLEGCVHVLSRHTTTALTINENEERLLDDVRQFLARMAPAAAPYLHNDLHLRPAPDGWPGGWAAWAAQEPRNAHSHLLSMVLGNSLTVPVSGGKLALGTWQLAGHTAAAAGPAGHAAVGSAAVGPDRD